jgi:hypothetical protein
MLVRKLNDNKVVVIALGYTDTQEQEFITNNPTGGFMLIDSLPDQPDFGQNYKWDGTAVVVDTVANAAATQDIVNREARDYLASTDWQLLRELDGGLAMTIEVKELRADARAKVV